MLPANHIFNTRIDGLPVHPSSAAFMAEIGDVDIHLDLGRETDQADPEYYGIPYNVVQGSTVPWANVAYTSEDTNLDWDPRAESDCASGASHAVVSPCTQASAPNPQLPIPLDVKVEGGIHPDVAGQDYGDHHILVLDTESCRLWEAYHAYTGSAGTWHIFGSATFDLRSNALRPDTWTSADAAGFPILPLLLRADEASSGEIKHALRFTIRTPSIRSAYVWPARHLNNDDPSTDLPPMGQLFRIKSTYVVPDGFSTQSKAILTALQRYGMYLADGGSNLYIQGEPSADWSETIFDEVQSVGADQFEAVDLSGVMSRPGFDPDSSAVPPG